MTGTALQRSEHEQVAVEAVIVRPAISVAEAKQLVTDMKEFRRQVLVPGVDFGLIPGVSKPSLFKPGAEKLLNIFGLGVRHIALVQIEDWDKPFFSYSYRAEVYVLRSGVVISDCEGSCNSYEDKYRYRVVMIWDATDEDKRNAVKVKERKKKKGGGTYKVFYVPNSEPFSLVNTLKKMAQKRAMIGAVLIATRASEEYTQDVEDQEHEAPSEEPAEQQQNAGQQPGPVGTPEAERANEQPLAPAIPLSTLTLDEKKQVFKKAKESGITKETFASWYTEVTKKPFLDIYPDDVSPLMAAATGRIAEAAVGHQANASGATA